MLLATSLFSAALPFICDFVCCLLCVQVHVLMDFLLVCVCIHVGVVWCGVQMATGKAQHYNAHKRYLLTLELKHESCMPAEELAEAEREDEEELERKVAAGVQSGDSEDSEDDEDEEEQEDSEDDTHTEDDEETTTDGSGEHQHSGDDMDEESLVIAREMANGQRDFRHQDSDAAGAGGGLLPLSLPVPDESELIPGGALVSLIAIPAPWEPWDQEKSLAREDRDRDRDRDRARRDADDMEIDIDPDGLSALRPPLARDEGSRIMHGNATTHEDCG